MCVCGNEEEEDEEEEEGERRVRGVNGEMNLKPEGDRPQKEKAHIFFYKWLLFFFFFSPQFSFLLLTLAPFFYFHFRINHQLFLFGPLLLSSLYIFFYSLSTFFPMCGNSFPNNPFI